MHTFSAGIRADLNKISAGTSSLSGSGALRRSPPPPPSSSSSSGLSAGARSSSVSSSSSSTDSRSRDSLSKKSPAVETGAARGGDAAAVPVRRKSAGLQGSLAKRLAQMQDLSAQDSVPAGSSDDSSGDEEQGDVVEDVSFIAPDEEVAAELAAAGSPAPYNPDVSPFGGQPSSRAVSSTHDSDSSWESSGDDDDQDVQRESTDEPAESQLRANASVRPAAVLEQPEGIIFPDSPVRSSSLSRSRLDGVRERVIARRRERSLSPATRSESPLGSRQRLSTGSSRSMSAGDTTDSVGFRTPSRSGPRPGDAPRVIRVSKKKKKKKAPKAPPLSLAVLNRFTGDIADVPQVLRMFEYRLPGTES